MNRPDEAGDTDDAVLLAELGRLLRTLDGPPPEVVQAGKELYAWRTVDAELAELVYDSLLDDGPALVRSAGEPRILSFRAGRLTIEVEVDERAEGRRLVGQLVPPQVADLELRTGTGEAVAGTRTDAVGGFVLDLPRLSGPLVVRCRLDDGSLVDSSSVAF